MNIQTIEVPQLGWSSDGETRRKAVSVVAPSWGLIEVTTREETAPRSRPIRGASSWRNDPMLRHAAKRRDNS